MLYKDRIALETGYFFTAMTFLTRIPVAKLSVNNSHSLVSSMTYFPLVGVVIGLLSGIIFMIASQFWHSNIALILTLSAAVIITGAFHEDGFADVCDSMGGFDKEKKLTIMKDSRLGTYGVVGLVCLFFLEFHALADADQDGKQILVILILAHCLSRWSSLPLIYLNPYVSHQSVSGKELSAQTINKQRFAIASLFTLALVLLLGWGYITKLVCGLIVVLISTHYYYRKSIGGISGDCLGATNKLTELMVYLVFAAS